MKISRIQLSNVLSFSEENPLDIELSDLNFIVGPNNSGKTNILRALRYFFDFVKYFYFTFAASLAFFNKLIAFSIPP